MILKSKIGEQEAIFEITQEKEHAIKVMFNDESIGDLLKSKELLSDDLGFILRLTFRITEVK